MKIGFFIGGFQKCASTWLHRSLQAHPGIFLPTEHMVHFFDIHFERGLPWYEPFFDGAATGQIVGDATVTYARSEVAMARIARYNPDARVVLILRNPIDRAWSHYWHERKKEKIAFAFEEWENNYDLFSDWILPGIYTQHIDMVESLFGKNQVLVIFHDDVASRPTDVLSTVCGFLGVDVEQLPAGGDSPINKTVVGRRRRYGGSFLAQWKARSEEKAYAAGPSEQAVARMRTVYLPVVRELEKRYSRELEHWLLPSA